ncbi:MAG: glycine cleavage system aminomethyltransferase GcvT [Euryarchaeota archaeon]|nr:glycine cleavage system aminomethyltransferase GcvT [Euryarchaeota archaeon]
MKLTLHKWHEKNAKKIADFAGYTMPIWYSGIKDEHSAVRNNVGIFDLSHMGEIIVKGNDAVPFLQYLTTNDISKPPPISATYALILNERGAIKDECLVYNRGEDYMVVYDAVAVDKIYAWFSAFTRFYDVDIINKTRDIQLYSVQGPKARNLCKEMFDVETEDMWWFQAKKRTYKGVDLIVSKSGYTGENGFELFFEANNEYSLELWKAILDKGAKYGIKPCGLGARDSLRVEAGYTLYGNDTKEKQLLSTDVDCMTPLEGGFEFAVSFDKEFIGKKAIENQKVRKKIMRFKLAERGIPRGGYRIFADGEHVGEVTSGSQSMNGEGIGLCFVDADLGKGDKIYIEIRDKKKKGEIVEPPFYDPTRFGASREGD